MTLNSIKNILTAALATIIWAAAPCGAAAQDSDMTPRLREIYNEASHNFRNAHGIVMADSLMRESRRLHSKDGELRAYTVIMKHECSKPGNEAGMERAVGRMMDFAMKNGFTDAFYSGVSFKVTYYTNSGEYQKAIDYQNRMLKYARQHGHSYGIVIGHISMGNIYRMHMLLVPAIDEYRQALDAYRRYNLKHDLGVDYKRIAECYIIAGHFDKALAAIDTGLQVSDFIQFVSALYGYRAFVTFMLDRDKEFIENYNKYNEYKKVCTPSIEKLIGNCLEVMKLIHDHKYDEAEKRIDAQNMGNFRKYVEIAYYKRRGEYAKVLETMRTTNILLYGDGNEAFEVEWTQMSADVNNNLASLDKQKAANINSRLELISTNLKLKNTELELARFKNAESLALMSAEGKRLSLNNQRLLARQLRDSLAQQRLQQAEQEQKRHSERTFYLTLIGTLAVLTLLAYRYLARNTRMTRQLRDTNRRLLDTQNDLNDANDKAQESDRQKTKFIQTMSHEVRTPLNAIVGFSQVLTDGEFPASEEDRQNMKQTISRNTDLLNVLINDILDLTSVESGQYEMKMETVHINELCHRALDTTRSHKAEGVSLRLETNLPDTFAVTSDGYRLMQVLTNMLSNAAKNTDKGSIVLACSISERPGMLTFTVTDTGIGVPRDKQEAIFERFYKIDQFKQGVGLGLELCRIIADKLGGAMGIDPEYDKGARFRFAIPV